MTEPKKPGQVRRQYRTLAEKHATEAVDRLTGPSSDKQRKVEAARLNQVFGERMYKARVEINGWSQQHAARLLGYSNSSPLAKIEMGGKFPQWLPGAAAKAYNVTTDFLLGVSDFDYECRRPGTEWEAAVLDSNKAFLQVMMQDHARFLARFAKTTGVTVDGIAQIMAKTSAVKEMFQRVQELNPGIWGEARGGTRLEVAVDELGAACDQVRRTADRARVDLRVGGHIAGISELLNGKLDFN
jgi:hypothetical protein